MIVLPEHKFLTIGEVAKISGVHIKSLRYYDRIGVLKPAYVDPNTNYRYYAYSQIGLVDVIRICVELDIPLKQFSDFVEKEGQEIHFSRLLTYGKELAERKIRAIRKGLRQIELFQEEIKRSEFLLRRNQPVFRTVQQKRYYTLPLDKAPNYDEYYRALGNLYIEAIDEGLTVSYESGLLYIYRKEDVRRYQFIEIMSGKTKSQRLLTLPSGQYLAKCVEQSKIETAPEEFPELFSKEPEKIVVESELFTGDYDISKPIYELRCYLHSGSSEISNVEKPLSKHNKTRLF